MRGFGGNDTYYVDEKFDSVIEAAGGGSDTVFARASFTLAAGQEVETLQAEIVGSTATLNIVGNDFAQSISGNNGTNTLNGLGGDDKLYGFAGLDYLYGGAGKDTLSGGLGNDHFVFNTALNAATNIDTIVDFKNVSGDNDTIRLENAIFTKLATTGALNANFFAANVTGTAADFERFHRLRNGYRKALLRRRRKRRRCRDPVRRPDDQACSHQRGLLRNLMSPHPVSAFSKTRRGRQAAVARDRLGLAGTDRVRQSARNLSPRWTPDPDPASAPSFGTCRVSFFMERAGSVPKHSPYSPTGTPDFATSLGDRAVHEHLVSTPF